MPKCSRLIKSYLESYAKKTNVEVDVTEVAKDHLHMLLFLNSTDFNLERCIIGFKKCTTNQLYYYTNSTVVAYLKRHFWYKNTFWSDEAFVSSIGNVSDDTMRKYIQSQGYKAYRQIIVYYLGVCIQFPLF